MNKKLTIYCVTNKPLKELEHLGLNLVGVGNNIFSNKYLLCNNGENINKKEKHYSELTFHYWFWKNELINLDDDEWVGFCQKRRFWLQSKNENIKNSFKDMILKDVPIEWKSHDAIICEHIKLETKFTKLLKRGWRNLLEKPTLLFSYKSVSIKVHFDMHHGHGVIDQAINLMDKKDRDEFRDYVNTKNKFNPHIMFITNKKLMDKYFNDLFNWLFKCEKIFGFENLKGYDQTRLYAYLSERYLSFWFKKNTKYLEWPWTFFDFESQKF
jgi:hypothetical protein